MTVPPNQPPRSSDEVSPRSDSPSAHATPDTTDAAPRLDQTTASSAPEHVRPATDAPSSPPAATYLSGIVTAGLAAICGAIFTSWAGVQGTLVGAMIGATVGSSVSEIVRAPLDTLERRLVAAGFSARRLRRDGVVKTVATSPAAAQQAFGMISKGAIVTVGATAIVGFLLAVGGVTAVEVAAGEPLSALVADAPATGTTVGNTMPNPPAALAPAPATSGGLVAGRGSGGANTSRPADPVLGSEDPAIAVSPSVPATSSAGNDRENTNSAVPPSPASGQAASVSAAPDATMQTAEATGTASAGPPTPTATASTTATAGGSVTATPGASPPTVQVVTVVVTATATASSDGATRPAGATSATAPASPTAAPVVIQTTTPTPTWTPTPTLTPSPPQG